jgi:hypothetical protein
MKHAREAMIGDTFFPSDYSFMEEEIMPGFKPFKANVNSEP